MQALDVSKPSQGLPIAASQTEGGREEGGSTTRRPPEPAAALGAAAPPLEDSGRQSAPPASQSLAPQAQTDPQREAKRQRSSASECGERYRLLAPLPPLPPMLPLMPMFDPDSSSPRSAQGDETPRPSIALGATSQPAAALPQRAGPAPVWAAD